MLHSPLLIPPSAAFWDDVAHHIVRSSLLFPHGPDRDLSTLRVVVPTFTHARLLKGALARQLTGTFIPPKIATLPSWLALQPPDSAGAQPAAGSERMMALYAELRQHAWLKKMFTARRNTDLLPLAQTLLTLADELTNNMLPAMQRSPDAAEQRWQAALQQLPPSARNLLSDEAHLVWTIWKSQLDENDAQAARLDQMLRLAQRANEPLIWISPIAADAFEQEFLNAYAERQTVLPVLLDWRSAAFDANHAVLAAAWHEMLDDDADSELAARHAIAAPPGVALLAAASLEDEAQRGAQTVIDWLQAGKTQIAIIAQDRVAARRIRALLERAQVSVTDETGWKLSTTRAAAALAAWLDVVATRADTLVLLDLLKSPFLFSEMRDRADRVMAIELALRNANVLSGWDAAAHALAALSGTAVEQSMLAKIAAQAGLFAGRRSLRDWATLTGNMFDALQMRTALEADAAGAEVIALLASIELDCAGLAQEFSFPEWRAFINLQLESTSFMPSGVDNRVAMLPLNGAHLRTFDAVLLVGADADHLPSQPNETLFFSNAVRRELGLTTRESLQRQQLRDFAELLMANRDVVLTWQAHRNGEPNPVSPWIARLQLTLERNGAATLPQHAVQIARRRLTPLPQAMPLPHAPQLTPQKLSASGYNRLIACPYQFFATRMLRLSGLDELSDMPEKRDYGDWLHRILKTYHEAVRDRAIEIDQRAQLLGNISEQVFSAELARNAAALGYYARWKKAMPAYLDWANAREAQGWHFVIGEQWFEKTLQWGDGEIILHGRIDRIDQHDSGERAVLDYKTNHQAALKTKLNEGEDQQLAFYGLLSDLPVAAAHFVALEPTRDKTGDVEAPNYAEWQQALEAQIKTNVRAIAQGAELPASGIESVCRYCEVRGLCRKGAW